MTLACTFFVNSQVPMPPISGSNPYEYIGNKHNSALHSFFSEYTAERVKEEKLSLKNLNKYLIVKSGIQEKDLAEDILNQPVFQNCRQTSFSNLPNQLEQMSAISLKCGNYLRSIDAAIESDLEIGFESFNNRVIILENEILGDQALSDVEKTVLLGTASTARYSAYFWKDYSEKMDSKAKGSNSTHGPPRWLKSILRADTSGAAGGAVAGAIAGAVGGAALGALADGAGNSTTNAVEQLWDWIFN